MASVVAAPQSLILARISGLMTAGPSILCTITTINAVLSRYNGRPLQAAILGGAAISIATDIIIWTAVVLWVLDAAWPHIVTAVITINFLKRVHSIVIAHLLFLRATALVQPLNAYKKKAPLYTAVYATVCAISSISQIVAYAESDFNSARGRSHFLFKGVYHPTNLVCVLLYASLAIATDVYFLSKARNNSMLMQRFSSIKIFYNPSIYILLELLMVFAVITPLLMDAIWSTNNTSPLYTEQLLLSLISLNSTFSVKAATVLPGEASGSGSASGSAPGQSSSASFSVMAKVSGFLRGAPVVPAASYALSAKPALQQMKQKPSVVAGGSGDL